MRVLLAHDRCVLFEGDSAKLGTVIKPNSVDSLVFDPPAGIAFMSKSWDKNKGGRDKWIAWLTELLRPSFIALKPGGFGLAWALPQTSHWTATAIENAGFEIWDIHHHAFGSGMPKSLDLARQIDMHLCTLPGKHCDKHLPAPAKRKPEDHLCPEHPRRVEAHGMRTDLKPAVEHWILFHKPIEGTYAKNVLTHGTGGLNVEACRVAGPPVAAVNSGAKGEGGPGAEVYGTSGKYLTQPSEAGRWPSHFSLEHCDACTEERCVLACPVRILDEQSGITKDGVYVGKNRNADDSAGGYSDETTRSGWKKDIRSMTYGGQGGASRFFYVAKAPRSEKDAGLDHLEPKTGGAATGREDDSIGTQNPRAGAGRTGGARNHHPCVKSIELMRWLVRLVTPPGGVVMDMFAGSGTTGAAALAEGLSCILIEEGGEDGEYLPILVGRLKHALAEYVEPGARST